MSVGSRGLSAIGRLASIALLAAAFLFGLAGVVYMSLQGSEVQVPEITGKNLNDGERELASLGLKIKKRADRANEAPPNTVIEQLPKPGETVKTGQMILVVTSRGPGEGVDKNQPKAEEDDTEKIEEMLDDKPKKAKANSNVNRKKADTTRDVSGNTSEGNSNSNSSETNSNKRETGANTVERPNRNTQPVGPKPPNTTTKPPETRPKPH